MSETISSLQDTFAKELQVGNHTWQLADLLFLFGFNFSLEKLLGCDVLEFPREKFWQDFFSREKSDLINSREKLIFAGNI